jgi:hypothetical protein
MLKPGGGASTPDSHLLSDIGLRDMMRAKVLGGLIVPLPSVTRHSR